ncbi:MAG: gfo/Idh/MocA family oxidoreductase [Bacteroidetes bacterium]|nr:MAG: gfo/Idh/MocA family oxidoreductase [Bacteroidota bacterium]
MKAAVIGLGRMGAEPSIRLQHIVPEGWLPISHTEAILNQKDLNLLAICDADEDKVTRFKNHYHIPIGYTDYKELLAKEKPEFLSIATRTSIRKDIIKAAVENGVRLIYAEKPLCNSVADCEEILALLKKHHVMMGYGVNRRYHYLYKKAKQLIHEGLIGDLKEIHVDHGYSNLLWTHPHAIDMLLFFAETHEFQYLQGKCNFSSPYTVQDTLIDDDPYVEHAYIKFSNGVQGVITNSGGTNIRLCGTTGNITIHGDGKMIECYSGTGYFYDRLVINEEPNSSATETVIAELLNAYHSNSIPPILPEEILAGHILSTGIVQSSLHNSSLLSPLDINKNMIVTGKLGNFYA